MGFRYIGAKEKLANIIIKEIREIKPDATDIIDLMAGTGQFSAALRQHNYKVSAVDVMTFSYHHLIVQLQLEEAPAFLKFKKNNISSNITFFEPNNYTKIIDYLNNIEGIEGYFFKEFSPDGIPSNTSNPRKYFTSENAKKIDAIRQAIKKMRSEETITTVEHSLLLHDLILATNDIANIAGTYGHYLSKFNSRALTKIKLKESQFLIQGNNKEHQVFRGYAEEIAPRLYGDICYIDPPYIKRQYAANYHILETIAREDEPDAIGESGLRPWRDQYSNFCSKVKIRSAFDAIFKQVNCNDFLISYSEDGLLSETELTSFFENYGNVSKKNIEYKRFKSNDSKKNATLNEFLFHIKKH